jgi:SAM-dependent methyltransferase
MKTMSFEEIYRDHPEIYRSFHSVVEHTENYFAFLGDRKLLQDVSTVFDIGAGFGELDLRLLEEHPALKLGYLEPSKAFSTQFKNEVKKRNLSERIVELRELSFESYQSTHHYDFVLSIHSWYPFGKDKGLLQKALRLLKPQGMLCISLVGPENFTFETTKMLGVEVGNFDSLTLSSWLQELGIPHEHILWDRKIHLEKIIRDGQFTQLGQGFLQFHTRCLWEEIPQAWLEKVKAYLFSIEQEGQLNLQNGCVLIKPAR